MRAGDKIRSGYLTPAVSGAPPHQSGGKNQKWPTSGQRGYLSPAVSGSPSASERGTKSEVAHKWARWLLNRCRLGEPHRIRAGDYIRSGYLTPPVSGSPSASERGAESEVAQKWARWLHNLFVLFTHF